MVFLAHIETGSTGNLARKLGSGDFGSTASSKEGQTDGTVARTYWTKISLSHYCSERWFWYILQLASHRLSSLGSCR